MKNVVFLGSQTSNPLDISQHVHHLHNAYRSCNVVKLNVFSHVDVHSLGDCIALDTQDPREARRKRQADILHISAHGDSSGIYVAQPGSNKGVLVYTKQLANFLMQHQYKVVYVDSCDSMKVAEDLVMNKDLNVKLAIGYDGPVNVTASFLGSRAFHNILAKGGSYRDAVKTLSETIGLLNVGVKLHVANTDMAWLSETLLPIPTVIARFAIDRPIGRDEDGCYSLEFGAYGFDYSRGERCVASFFSDDETLVGGAYTTVESGMVRSGQVDPSKGFLWTNNYRAAKRYSELWEVKDCDFSIYMSYFYDGEYDIVRTTVKEALQNYYMSDKFNVPDEDKAQALPIIDQLP